MSRFASVAALAATSLLACGEGGSTPQPPASEPSAPTAPRAVQADAGVRSATITWSPPASDGGSAISGYTVTGEPGGLSRETSALQVEFDALENGTTYTFTVRASNEVGEGPASEPTSATTPDLPGAPSAVLATAGDGTAQVAWMAPASDGGSAVTGYVVRIAPAVAAAAVAVEGTGATITGLANGTAYTFRVRAVSEVGEGPESEPSNPVTPAAGRATLPVGEHEFSFTVDSAASLPVSGISFVLALPPGVTVDADPVTGAVAEGALVVRGALPGTHVVSGSWNPGARQVRVVVAATPDGAWGGEFLRMRFRVGAGASVAVEDLLGPNAGLPGAKAVAIDAADASSRVISGQTTLSLSVVSR